MHVMMMLMSLLDMRNWECIAWMAFGATSFAEKETKVELVGQNDDRYTGAFGGCITNHVVTQSVSGARDTAIDTP